MDRVLFGDNQFFGVDHLSFEKAREKQRRFQDTKAILRVLDEAHEIGLRTFMCTTYQRVSEICDYFRANPAKFDDWKIYPCMPYAHKYANAVTELGITGTLRRFTDDRVAQGLLQGGRAILDRDATRLMHMLVDAELTMFKGVNTSVIFLQNVVTDLLLGLGMEDFFKSYADHINEEYKAEAGFITMNLPLCVERLQAVGIAQPVVCASINKMGFRMTGGIALNEATLNSGKVRAIAMQVLAAGALRPTEALEYICSLEGVESILFGASTRAHIEETFSLINEAPSQKAIG